MRFIRYILAIFLTGFVIGCDRTDDCSPVAVMDASTLSGDTPLDVRIKEMYEKYEILFKYEFDIREYEYNWTESLSGMPYTPADPAYGIKVIDSLEKWVFGKFPEGFIQKYLQPNILLVDSVKMEYLLENYDTGEKESSWYTLVGNVSKNNITVAMVCSHFENNSPELEEEWISLFVERMMLNANFWPYPKEFAEVNGGKTGILGAYWSGNLADKHQWFASYPEGSMMENFEWWGKGVLKPGRLRCSNELIMYGMSVMYGYWKGTVAQDFGDYVAFIVTKTTAEKEAFWNKVREKAVPYGYDATKVVGMMKKKVELVQQYFKTNFGFELSEPK